MTVAPAGSRPQSAASWTRWSARAPREGSAPRESQSFWEVSGMIGLRRTATARRDSAAV
ncbi:hypothetical protein SVIOM342S_01409 [Streptomyces violaceorubidus]